MRFGWTLDDWIWRLVALVALVLYPAMVIVLWKHDRGSLLASAGEMAKDIGLTIVYGNYDRASILDREEVASE